MTVEQLKQEEMRQLLTTLHAVPQPQLATRRRRLPLLLAIGTVVLVAVALIQLRRQWGTNPATLTGAAPALHASAPVAQVASVGAALDASGFVYATRHATVSSDITGRVAHIYTQEGARVKKGELLADLEPSNFLTQIALGEAELVSKRNLSQEAEVQLAEARNKFDRTQLLVERGFISNQQLDTDQYRITLLQAQLATSRGEINAASKRLAIQQQQLVSTRILAPFDGVVVEQPAQVGEIVSPISAGGGFTRTGICTLIDSHALEVQVNVNEQFIGKVHPDQAVRIRLQAYPELVLKGAVSAIMPAASRDTAAVKVKIAFASDDPRVLPNMSANVAFE